MGFERKRKTRVKTYDELTFADDFMFCKIMENNEDICRELIELILDIKIKIVHDVRKQKPIEIIPDGKGIRLDVQMIGDDTVFNLEMQNVHKYDLPFRSRYYQALMDLDQMERGASYCTLMDTVIIFICTFDPFGKGLGKYTVGYSVEEDPEMSYNDGTRKVFLSSAPSTNDGISSELRGFLNYLNGKSPEDDLTRRIDEAMERAKSQEGWRKEYMLLEEKYRDYLEEGREEGREEGQLSAESRIVQNMHNKGLSYEEIADMTGMDVDKVERLIVENL